MRRFLLFMTIAVLTLQQSRGQETVWTEVTEGDLTYLVSKSDNLTMITNKEMQTRYEAEYKGKNKNASREEYNSIISKMVITTPDADIASAIKAVFTDEELLPFK